VRFEKGDGLGCQTEITREMSGAQGDRPTRPLTWHRQVVWSSDCHEMTVAGRSCRLRNTNGRHRQEITDGRGTRSSEGDNQSIERSILCLLGDVFPRDRSWLECKGDQVEKV
jgi:hypothetical protein